MGNLHQLTIIEAAHLIRAKRVTVTELVMACLTRIKKLDDKVQAFRLVDEEGALQQAKELEEELKNGKDRGLLHGIPIGIKDIFDVKGLPTRAGSDLLDAAPVAERDSGVAEKLRKAGAVILGKTHTTAFAYYDPAPTRNPYLLDHTPGGSSSGSAAAAALDMAFLTIGSQTNASICRPGAYSGVWGFKPTFNRLPVTGVMPLAQSFDTPGFFARNSVDLIAAFSAFDESLVKEGPHFYENTLLKGISASPCIIGVLEDPLYLEASSDVKQALTETIDRLEAYGYQVEPVSSPVSFHSLIQPHHTIMAYEAARSYKNFALDHPFSGRFALLIEEGLALTEEVYEKAQRQIEEAKEVMAAVFQRYDCLLAPPTDSAAPKGLDSTGNPKFTTPWTVFDCPLLVMPVGLNQQGLPLSLMLAGAKGKDLKLLETGLFMGRILGAIPKPKRYHAM